MVARTYTTSEIDHALRQGEILTNFTQYQLDVDKLVVGVIEVIPVIHPFVVIISQDCDLDQDYTRRLNGETENLLASVLFCAIAPNNDEFRREVGLNTKEWGKVRQNREPRLHCLRSVPNTSDRHQEGLPDLVVDFRQYFAVPTREAYHVAEVTGRRCRLEMPYADHLNNRFAAYMSRVALPLDHDQPLPVDDPALDASPEQPVTTVQRVVNGVIGGATQDHLDDRIVAGSEDVNVGAALLDGQADAQDRV